MLVYILIGYALTCKKIINKTASKILSSLLVWVFSPFYTIVNLSKNVSIEKITNYLSIFLFGALFVVLAIVAAVFVSKAMFKKGYARNMYTYLLAFSNGGYFGYPLVEALFGGEVLASYMIFYLSTSVAINTFGYYILTTDPEDVAEQGESAVKNKKSKFSFLYSPPIIATYIGLLLGFLPITVPDVVYDFLTPGSNCMSASAMLLVGCVLAGVPLIKLITSMKAYVIALVRLLLFPIIFGSIGYFCYRVLGSSRDVFVFFTIVSCLPAGMNVVVFPESVGKDGSEGASACCISYVLCLISIPIVINVMQMLP